VGTQLPRNKAAARSMVELLIMLVITGILILSGFEIEVL
jgi:hypothetical protein